MNHSLLNFKRSFLIVFFIVVTLTSIDTINRRSNYGLKTINSGADIIVSQVNPESAAGKAGVQIGDHLISVDGRQIYHPALSKWYLTGVDRNEHTTILVERKGVEYSFDCVSQSAFNLPFRILTTILSLTFLLVGFIVWWAGAHDSTVRAFFRLTGAAGLSNLLFSHENYFQAIWLHQAYAFLWFFLYCMIPAMFVAFLLKFTNLPSSSDQKRLRVIRVFYYTASIVFLVMITYYHRAFSTQNPGAIILYESIFSYLFGSLLVICLSFGVLVLFYRYRNPGSEAEKDRIRWLLLCTFIGLAPFIFLYKLPTVFGYGHVIPIWVSSSFMLIVPIGWGMAVTSFRMLRLEWVLTRSIIYIITLALVVYLVLITSLISVNYVEDRRLLALIPALVVGLLFSILIVSGIASFVRRGVDRIYYRDWFSYRRALRELSGEISLSINTTRLIDLLTVRLPEILKIRSCVLLILDEKGGLVSQGQTTDLSTEILTYVSDRLSEAPVDSADSSSHSTIMIPDTRTTEFGLPLILVIRHAGEVLGVLLLGEKLSGAPFSLRDYTFLNTLSHYAGTSISNIRLTEQLIDHGKRTVAVEMAGSIAHEINNALGPLLGQVQLMKRQVAAEGVNKIESSSTESMSVIVNMCDRIKRIVNNLNHLSEPPRLVMEQLSLSEVAEDSIQLLTETAGRIKRFKSNQPDAKFNLVRELSDDLSLIKADRQQLGQVFLNLILNAADALEDVGQGTLTVGTRKSTDGKSVVGYVYDDGPGIPTEVLERIFQPYYTTKPQGKGTGLGMAIVRNILDYHGGTITVQSTEGEGSRFEFTIPLSEAVIDKQNAGNSENDLP